MQRDEMFGSAKIRDGATPTAKAVLVKFTFNNPKHIPDGISQQGRSSDAEMDKYHASIAAEKFQDPSLGEIGRHRAGRVDTGNAVVNNAQQVHAAIVRRALRNNAFVLSDLSYFEKKQDRQPTKYVVQAAFRPLSADVSPDSLPSLPRRTVDALRALAETCWNFCHVWENPDGNVTVNFVGRQPDQKPKRAIIIQGGQIQVGLIDHLTAEEEENEASMNAAFALWNDAGYNPRITGTAEIADKLTEAGNRTE